MSTILEQCDRIIEEVDRAMGLPSGCCLVCSEPSAREFCCNHCRWVLWKLRRGLERECLDLQGLR